MKFKEAIGKYLTLSTLPSDLTTKYNCGDACKVY